MAATSTPPAWSLPVRLFTTAGEREPLVNVPKGSGAYRIRVLNCNMQPEIIRRVDGDDVDGILHIGESEYLRDRIRVFQKVAAGGKGSHQAGSNFSDCNYARKFSLQNPYVDYQARPTKQGARNLEHELHEQYQAVFLDRPPLDAKG